jgi:hypothetical protein
MSPKKLKPTSIDSKLSTQEKFQQSLQSAIQSNENILRVANLEYVAEYKTHSPHSHSRITYKVIARNQGCSVLIKLTKVLNVGSGLRKQSKVHRHSKRLTIKWTPRLKTRY